MISVRSTWLAAVATAALFVGIAPFAHGQTERRTLSGEHVAIYNLVGSLRVQGGTGSRVTVDVTRAGRDAERLEIATGAIRGFETLRIIYPSERIVYPRLPWNTRTELRVDGDGTFDDDSHGGWFEGGRVEIRNSGSGLEAYANLVVSIPRGRQLSVHWGVGDATLTNVDGDIHLSVAGATVNAEHTRGLLDLDTGSGSVTIADAQGDLVIDAGSGGVRIDGVRGERLDLDTGSGAIRADDVNVRTLNADVGSGGVTMTRVRATRIGIDAGSGMIDLGLMSVVEDLSIDAGSGGVTLRLPATQGGEIDIETGSGGIDSDFPVQTTHIERNSLRGRIGDGRGRIKIESGSGRIRLIKG